MMKKYFKKALKYAANFFFPITCSGCGRDLPAEDRFRICPDCFGKLELIQGHFCAICGKALPDGGELCYVCIKNPRYHFDFIRSAGEYKGVLRKLLQEFKYFGKDYYVRIFEILIKDLINKEKRFEEAEVVIPVPMHWIKRIKRGYNQSEFLAAKAAKYLQKPVINDALIRRKFTKPQFNLDKAQRAENIRDSIAVRDQGLVKGKKILLVDDIATSCATIEQCSISLKRAGASKIFAFTIARD